MVSCLEYFEGARLSRTYFNQKSGGFQKKFFPKLVLASEGQPIESVWDDYVKEFGKLDVAGFEAFITNKVKDRVAGKW